ncbi:MucBP domain-containing protein [Arcanobacterium haemolyticum]|nr:MucBP domain-containing protein [Arcanobacterium haemolyticum]
MTNRGKRPGGLRSIVAAATVFALAAIVPTGAFGDEAQPPATYTASTEISGDEASGSAPENLSIQGQVSPELAATNDLTASTSDTSSTEGVAHGETPEADTPVPAIGSDDAATAPAESPAAAAAATSPETATPEAATPAAADPATLTELWVNGSTGDDANDGAADASALKTLAKALTVRQANQHISTIHVAGRLTDFPAATIPAGVTLLVSADTTITGTAATALTVAKGAALKAENGAKLSMSGFDTAILVQDGATLTDGTYILTGNKVGLHAQGNIAGTSREALNISIDSTTGAKTGRAFEYSGTARFNSLTLSAKSIMDADDKGLWGGRGGSLYITDSSMSFENVRFNVQGATTVQMKNSTFSVKGTFAKREFLGFALEKETLGFIGTVDSLIEDSHVIVDGAVFTMQGPKTYRNSTVEVKNSGMGAININWGANVVFDSSTIKVDEGVQQTKIVVGGTSDSTAAPSSVTLTGDTVLITPAKGLGSTTYDGIALGPTGGAFVVTGGSHLTAYDGKSNLSNTQATNGEANGNEKLSLFTLADPSVTVLNPINKNGETYEYRVANATSDGQKHVWVPAATVTFALNDPTLADDAKIAGAKFADDTTKDKVSKSIRGHAIATASSVVAGKIEKPANPTAEGYVFDGWAYKDADGVEHAFDLDKTAVPGDITVYATWDDPASHYNVVYHTNHGTDVAYTAEYENSGRDYTALTLAEAIEKNAAFNISNRTFVGWNTKADGSGTSVTPGATQTVPAGVTSVDLYAQWETPTTPFTYEGSISGDMWGSSASGQDSSTAPLKVKGDGTETFSLTGAVDVSGIKGQMTAIEGMFPGVKAEDITLSGTTSTFTASFTLPEGVVVPSSLDATKVETSGLGDLFKLTDVKVEGQKVTATLTLTKAYTTYLELKKAVMGTGSQTMFRMAGTSPIADQITLTFPGFRIDPTNSGIVDGAELVAVGSVTGMMKSVAQGGDTKVAFTLSWNGEQAKGGKDVNAPDETTIQQTILVVKPAVIDLPADMLGYLQSAQIGGDYNKKPGSDTAAQQPVSAFAGSKVNITGSINAATIKNQMTAVEARFNVTTKAGREAIKLADLSSTFTATFTLPDKMTLPSDLANNVLLTGFSDTFVVDSVAASADSKTATVTLKLKDGITTYEELKTAVDAVSDTMLLTVMGVAIDDSATNTQLTVAGSVTGNFAAVATKADGDTIDRQDFAFTWAGKQTPEGKDYLAANLDTIQLTFATPAIEKRTIPGDILSGSDTQHTSVYTVGSDRVFDVTGAVSVDGIKAQMKEIEEKFGVAEADFSKIRVDVNDFGFTATLNAPPGINLLNSVGGDGLKWQPDIKGMGNAFINVGHSAGSNGLIVDFALNDDVDKRIDTYEKLKDAIDSAGVEIPGMPGKWITITVPAVKVLEPNNSGGDGFNPGDDFTLNGKVSGDFKAVASIENGPSVPFSFEWDGTQWADGKDSTAAANDTSIRFTGAVLAPKKSEIEGDILSGGDSTSVYKLYPGRTLDLTGAVKIDGIKAQMEAIESQYKNPDGSSIAVDIKNFGFTATLTLPEGMSFPKELDAAKVNPEGLAETFVVKDVAVEGQTATITFALKDAASLTTYAKLKEAVAAAGADNGTWLKVTIPGVTVADSVKAGEQLTVMGTVNGAFEATATSASGTTKPFAFAWNGKQWAPGTDVAAGPDTESIRFTLVVPDPQQLTLPGDMLVGSDTEHEAVITKQQGESFDLTGAVDVSSIKAQMGAIEEMFGKPEASKIAVDIASFGFTAALTLPEGMTLPEGLTPEQIKADDFGGFVVTNVTTSGQTATITFGLKDVEKIKTYADLKTAVEEAGGTAAQGPAWMKVTIPGVTIGDDVAAGTKLTATGTVTGHFGATASVESGKREVFLFDWTANQWTDGLDAAFGTYGFPTTNAADITLTVEVTEKPVADGKVTVSYVDEDGKKIADDVVLTGKIGDEFTAQKKTIDGYTFKEVVGGDENLSGAFAAEDQTVTLVYVKDPVKGADVTVTYVDEAGNEIADSVTLTGNVGESYTSEQKVIEGYTFKGMGEGSAPVAGEFSGTAQTVIYVYVKNDEPSTPGTDEPSTPGTDEPSTPGTDEPSTPGAGESSEPGAPGMTTKPGKPTGKLPFSGASVSTLAALTVALTVGGVFILRRRKEA